MSEVNLQDYFEQQIPAAFRAAMADISPEIKDQEELVVGYVITGEAGMQYTLRVAGGTLVVEPSLAEDCDMVTTVSREQFIATHLTAWDEPAVDYFRRGKVRVIKGLKGTLRYELSTDEGGEYNASTVFQRVEAPEVTLRMTVPDYAAMVKGQLNGNMAFMTGKLKFEGSLPLLMQLGALNS